MSLLPCSSASCFPHCPTPIPQRRLPALLFDLRILQGFCIRGDSCPYAHGVFECWLHPSRYRSQLCKDGVNCHRPVCFFAHSLPELRAPTYTWLPTPEDLAPRNAAAVAAAAAAAASSGVSPSAAAALTMTQQMHAAVAGLASASSSPAAGAGADKAGQRLGPQDCVVPEGQHPGSSRSASGALQQQDVDGMLAPGSPAASMLKEQHSKDGALHVAEGGPGVEAQGGAGGQVLRASQSAREGGVPEGLCTQGRRLRHAGGCALSQVSSTGRLLGMGLVHHQQLPPVHMPARTQGPRRSGRRTSRSSRVPPACWASPRPACPMPLPAATASTRR